MGRDCGRQRGELQSHGRERSHRGAEGKAERFPHRGSVPTGTHQPERLVCSPAGAGRGLGAEARALVLARRESGKKSAAAEEAGDFFLPLCFAACKERGFRAPPK